MRATKINSLWPAPGLVAAYMTKPDEGMSDNAEQPASILRIQRCRHHPCVCLLAFVVVFKMLTDIFLEMLIIDNEMMRRWARDCDDTYAFLAVASDAPFRNQSLAVSL